MSPVDPKDLGTVSDFGIVPEGLPSAPAADDKGHEDPRYELAAVLRRITTAVVGADLTDAQITAALGPATEIATTLEARSGAQAPPAGPSRPCRSGPGLLSRQPRDRLCQPGGAADHRRGRRRGTPRLGVLRLPVRRAAHLRPRRRSRHGPRRDPGGQLDHRPHSGNDRDHDGEVPAPHPVADRPATRSRARSAARDARFTHGRASSMESTSPSRRTASSSSCRPSGSCRWWWTTRVRTRPSSRSGPTPSAWGWAAAPARRLSFRTLPRALFGPR